MKKIVSLLAVFTLVAGFAAAQTKPPYNVTHYYWKNMTRTEFDAVNATNLQRDLQNVNSVVYKKFFEVAKWDDEDNQMVEWVHNEQVLPGTKDIRQNGDVWEMYVQRYNNDGWFVIVRWSYDDAYTYRLFYYQM